MDTISAYLNGMRILDFEGGAAEARSPWGVSIPASKWDIVFYGLEGAECRISLPPSAESIEIHPPAICIILNGKAHIVQDSGKTSPNSPVEMREPDTIERFRFKSLGGESGPATNVFYMGLDLGRWGSNPLLEALPKILILEFDQMPHWSALVSNWMRDELLADRVGRHSKATRLGELLVLEAIRSYVDQHRSVVPAWLRPAQDERLKRALALLHADLARDWRLDDLAAEAGTSRSRLCACAQAELGEGIFQYLQRWRMYEARRLLRETNFEVDKIARLVGYRAQNAFITAFGREVGLSPGRYRRVDR